MPGKYRVHLCQQKRSVRGKVVKRIRMTQILVQGSEIVVCIMIAGTVTTVMADIKRLEPFRGLYIIDFIEFIGVVYAPPLGLYLLQAFEGKPALKGSGCLQEGEKTGKKFSSTWSSVCFYLGKDIYFLYTTQHPSKKYDKFPE